MIRVKSPGPGDDGLPRTEAPPIGERGVTGSLNMGGGSIPGVFDGTSRDSGGFGSNGMTGGGSGGDATGAATGGAGGTGNG